MSDMTVMIPKSKVLITLFTIIGLLILACATNEAIKSRYELEKKFYAIEKFLKDSQIKPELNNQETANRLHDLYRDFINHAYTSLDNIDSTLNPKEYDDITNMVFAATRQYSQILFSERTYDSCLYLIDRLINKTSLKNYQRMTAYVSMGQTLQVAGRWDSAIVIYNYAVKNFYPPVSADSGIAYDLFNLPLHVFNIYQQTGDSLNARKYFVDAERYYQTLIKDFPESEFYVAARSNLARLYYNDGRWRQAIEQLSNLVDSTGIINPSANMKIADIYAVELRKLDTALLIYDFIEKHLSPRDSLFKPVLLHKKSMVYLEKKQYTQTRTVLIELANQYPAYYEYYPTPQYIKARSFELEGNWSRAETEYKFLIENYPGTREAMSTHLYLARKLDELGRKGEASRWREKAENYFNEIASQNRGTLKEATALSYRAEMFRQDGNWLSTAVTMTEIFDKFPQTEIGQRAVLTAAEIYRQKLNNPVKADSLIAQFRQSLTKTEEEWGT